MFWSFMAWAQQNPIITAGLITFAGVVVALCGNAGLAALDRRAKQRHERHVVTTALLAELQYLHREYSYREGRIAAAAGHFDVPLIEATDVYDRLLDRIGLLNLDQVGKVIHAYLGVKHLDPNLHRMEAESKARGAPDRGNPGPHHLRIDELNFALARTLYTERIGLFQTAIDALRKA